MPEGGRHGAAKDYFWGSDAVKRAIFDIRGTQQLDTKLPLAWQLQTSPKPEILYVCCPAHRSKDCREFSIFERVPKKGYCGPCYQLEKAGDIREKRKEENPGRTTRVMMLFLL